MSEQEHKVLKEQRNRRKRVQHIRIGIITARFDFPTPPFPLVIVTTRALF